ncbi:MAG: M20/M25/M40 family metallo-hydrolase [Terriglobales bacterium]
MPDRSRWRALWLVALFAAAAPAAQAPTPALDGGNPTLRAIARVVSAARIRADIQRLVAFGTRSSLSDPSGANGRGVGAARDWIAAQFRADSVAAGGRLQVRLDSFTVPAGPRVPQAVTMTDVVAILPGADPNDHRIFVVGGHYDSRATNILDGRIDAPGANDDGSGTSVVLECARVLSRYRFPASIEFIAFEGEEQGLDGSKHAAEEAQKAGQRIVAMLNNDIVGGDNTPGRANRDRLRVFSEGVPATADATTLRRLAAVGGEVDSPSREIARYASALASAYLPGFSVVLEYRRDRYLRGGDHISFNLAGYPAVRFTDYHENYHHQHQTVRVENGVQFGDLPRFTTPAYTANVARVNALALAALALAPAAPEHVYFLPRLETGTSLRWAPVAGAVAYRILLRPTAAPQWTVRRTVQGTQAHLDESKDNYFMAVAAVGPHGLESPPTLPSLPPFRRRPAVPAAAH